MTFRPVLCLPFLRLLLTCIAWAQSAPVEVTHPVIGYLRRMEEKGWVDPGFTSTLPLDEGDVKTALQALEFKGSALSGWDRTRLEGFLDEFDPERRRNQTRLHYGDSAFQLEGGAEYFTSGVWEDSLPKPEGYAFGSFTPRLSAAYHENLYLISSATIGMERNHLHRFVENYDPQRGLSYNTNREGKSGIPQKVSTFDGFRAVMGYGSPTLRFEAGQDWNQWGPGHWQHATLGPKPYFWVADSLQPNDTVGFLGSSALQPGGYRRGYRVPGEGPPLPQLRLRMGFGRWEYVKIIAQRTGLWRDSSATLVADRLQISLGSRWRLGFSEMLAIGTRTPDPISFVPAVPLKFVEHAGGDRDNAALAADAEWLWGHGRLYGEFYVDDYSGPPLQFWGNKFAYLFGGSWQDPGGLPMETHLEFAATDPWVFEHNQRNTAMQSDGALLGSVLPPNSQGVFASVEFPLPRGIQAVAEWHWRMHDFGSPGSSIFDVHDSTDGPNKAFLAANVETRNEATLSATWAWKRFVTLKSGIGGLWIDNWHGFVNQSLATPSLFGEIHLRY